MNIQKRIFYKIFYSALIKKSGISYREENGQRSQLYNKSWIDEVKEYIGCIVRPTYTIKIQRNFLYDDNKANNTYGIECWIKHQYVQKK